MTASTVAAAPRFIQTTETDLYRAQREALSDLVAFIDAHAPRTAAPLPVIPWRVDDLGHMLISRLSCFGPDPSGIRADPRKVLAAYAAALGAEVVSLPMDGRTRYTVRGQIGRREGTAQQPRTKVYLEADLWDDEAPEQAEAAREALPAGATA